MRQAKIPRNKMVVALRQICEVTKDRDLSYGNLSKVFDLDKATLHEIYERHKERHSIKHLIKKDKLSTDDELTIVGD